MAGILGTGGMTGCAGGNSRKADNPEIVTVSQEPDGSAGDQKEREAAGPESLANAYEAAGKQAEEQENLRQESESETEAARQESGNGTDAALQAEQLEAFYETCYGGMTEQEIMERVNERSGFYQASGYYEEVTEYWETTRGVGDIANRMEPLYFTDMRLYSEEDFTDAPALIIHLAKNEIYARHGYRFQNEDLKQYFMGCIWYEPLDEGGTV